MEVKNLGADSVVDGYSIWINVAGTLVEGRREFIPEKFFFPNGYTLYGKDALYLKTVEHPVRRGAKVVGLLWAWFNDYDHAALRSGRTVVKFSDVRGREYKAEAEVIGQPDEKPLYFPGLSPPMVDARETSVRDHALSGTRRRVTSVPTQTSSRLAGSDARDRPSIATARQKGLVPPTRGQARERVRMELLPEKPNPRSTSIICCEVLPAIRGQGTVDYLCAGCGAVVCESLDEGQVQNLVFECPECHAFSRV
jgi:hypothetical protein